MSAVPSRENQSVHKAAALLRAAADVHGGASVSALARATDLPRATALRMIESLLANGLLARLPDDRVVIGPEVHRLARAADLTQMIVQASRGVLEELVGQVSESVTLTVARPDGSLDVVRQVDGPYLLGLTHWVGRPFDLHASSAGKLYLAHTDDAHRESVLRRPLPRRATRTVTDAAALRAELAVIAEQDWSQIEDELEDGLAAVSVPIRLHGRMVASINVSGPTTRFDTAARRAALAPVRTAARRLEAALR